MPKDCKDNNGHLRCDACDYQKLKKLENNPDVRELRDKIEQMNIRLSECRTENQMLKRSLYLAKQMVYKEVGETSGDFKTLLKHGEESGFRVERRTRTENVLVLRKKVQDLQDYLRKLEGHEPDRCKAQKTPSEEFVKKRIPEERKAYWRMELERRIARENAEKEITPIAKECSELRKKIVAEKAQFRDLNNELNLLRAEYQSQVLKSEEDMGLIQSFETLQTQLQETLKERAEIREELAGYRERNRRLEGEISTTKDELQMLYNRAKDNNILIDSLTNKHKQIQEAIESEKSIVRQNVDRYRNELQDMRENYEEDLKLLDTLQKITYERNSFIDKLNEDIIEGIEIVVEEPEVIEKPPEIVPAEESQPPADETSKKGKKPPKKGKDKPKKGEELKQEELPTPLEEVKEEIDTKALESNSKILQMMIECAKYKTLLDAARVENDRLTYITSLQEKQMNDVATQVVETGRIIMQKDAEKKDLSDKIQKLQKSIAQKKKKLNVFVQAKNELEELAIKVEAQREENDFLRSFLNSAVENKFEEFDLYRTFVTETREFFVNTLQEIKDTLKQKEESLEEKNVPEPSAEEGAAEA